MKPKIVWEKFKNPVRVEQEMIKESIEDSKKSYSSPYEAAEESHGGMYIGAFNQNGVPINDSNDPAVTFNLWIFHTNFDITLNFLKFVNTMRGIEELKPISRYRALIGFGKLFVGVNETYADIRQTITKKMKSFVRHNYPEFGYTVLELSQKLSAKYPHWYVYFNQGLAKCIYNYSEEFNTQFSDELMMAKEISSGQVLHSTIPGEDENDKPKNSS